MSFHTGFVFSNEETGPVLEHGTLAATPGVTGGLPPGLSYGHPSW